MAKLTNQISTEMSQPAPPPPSDRGGGASTDPVSKPGQKKKNGILAKNPVWKKKKKWDLQFWEKIDFFWYLTRASESDQKWPHEQSDPVTARTRLN